MLVGLQIHAGALAACERAARATAVLAAFANPSGASRFAVATMVRIRVEIHARTVTAGKLSAVVHARTREAQFTLRCVALDAAIAAIVRVIRELNTVKSTRGLFAAT